MTDKTPADFLTVGQLIATLGAMVAQGDIKADDAFVTSADPEGNRFLAYQGIEWSPTKIKAGERGWDFSLASTGHDGFLLMPTFEIDPEY